MDFGWGNGYVIIPKGHPLHGKHYDELNQIVDVHRGLTFSGSGASMSDLVDESEHKDWVVGFDTAHYGDSLAEWPKDAVEAETERLKKQLEDCFYLL